jgi:hypothetical protein
MKTTTTKKQSRKTNKPGSQAEYIGELFALLDHAEASGVPWRVVYDADDNDTIIISLEVNDLQVTRAAAAMGFTVTRHEQIGVNIYRGAEAYLECEEPNAVFAIKAWMHYQGAQEGPDGGMVVEYYLTSPAEGTAFNN